MKTRSHSLGLHLLFPFFFTLSIFIQHTPVSPFPLSPAPECGLNFTKYPYVGFSECGDVHEDIHSWGWDGFPATMCCRNALTSLSDALAVQANISGNLFVSQSQWQNCTNMFHPQQGMSIDSCGFHSFYYGSFNCTSFSMQDVQSMQQYPDALNKCSHFDQPYVESCATCTAAILNFRDALFGNRGNDTDRAICGVAALVALAAGKPDDPSLADKFLRCLPYSAKKSKNWASMMLITVPLVVAVMLVMALAVKYVWSKKKSVMAAQLTDIASWSGLYCFTKGEIERAMNYGDEKVCLGRGSAGIVYRGVLPSGQLVAIKHLTKSNTCDSFTREVEGLSRLRHPNLVCLFGCCIEGDQRYLVYEFCANGNLAQHLLRKDRHLKWETRVRILRDCSFALKYLHHHIEGCVVHRDIKLTNILLNEKYQAKLSDFGLARMMGMEESKVFTDIRGTIGYMDPEYMSNARLTCASDVYSFGIVALQILSGQKVIELELDARDQLTRKARDVSMGKRPLSDFEDPRLNGEVNRADFEAILHIAVLCVAKQSKGRPTIEVVFEELDKCARNSKQEKSPSASTPSTVGSSKLVSSSG